MPGVDWLEELEDRLRPIDPELEPELGSGEISACWKPWSSNQSASPICPGSWRMNSRSWSLKKAKSAKNAV